MHRKCISIIVPVYNEEANIRPLYEAVSGVFDGLSDRYDYELLFTDNHSTDSTFSILRELADRDARIRVLRFSRNVGYQRSIYTGYVNARGEAAIQLDCDLQDPPDLIPRFLELWEAGNKVVYGVRRRRREFILTRLMRWLFYRLVNLLSSDDLPHDAGDFRLVDRRILDQLKQLNDHTPYLRGTIATMGFRQTGVPYDRAARERGVSAFTLPKLIGFAFNAILSQSHIPLRLSTYAGLLISVVTFVGACVYTIFRLVVGHHWPPGWVTLVCLVLLSTSLNALFLGIIGEYLGRIYQQTRNSPTVIIEHQLPPVHEDGA